MHTSTKKWIFTKISSAILIPLKFWLILNISSILQNDASLIIEFMASQPSKLIFSLFLVVFFLFFSLTISEIFEDYINNEKMEMLSNAQNAPWFKARLVKASNTSSFAGEVGNYFAT